MPARTEHDLRKSGEIPTPRPPMPRFRVVLSPDWDALDELRDFIASWLKRRFTASLAARATLAVHELLELSLRFGLVTGDLELEIYDGNRDGGSGHGYELRISNEMLALRVEFLRRKIESLPGTDAATEYQQLMKQVASGQGDEVSLGLARLRHEANVEMELEVDGRRVTIVARGG